MNSTLLCTFHACPMSCQAQECQLLAYVRELERDKARLDWVGGSDRIQDVLMELANPAYDLRLAIDAAMQAMKEGK